MIRRVADSDRLLTAGGIVDPEKSPFGTVYAVVDDALSPDFPLGDALDVTKVLAGQARLTFPAESRNLSSCG
jgi:hypothetical protein